MKQKNLFEKLIVFLFVAGLFWVGYGLNIPVKNITAENPKTNIYFLNVGQGDATLIKTASNKSVLIDGGPDKSILYELGNVIEPWNKKIDYIIVTHPHADHMAGLNYVLDSYEVENIYINEKDHNTPDFLDFLERVEKINCNVVQITDLKEVGVDEVRLVFHQYWNSSLGTPNDLNETSSVIEAIIGENKLLVLGDLPDEFQDKALNYDLIGKIDILKVAHHGAKDGASTNLLAKTKPKYAIISVGKDNYYNHPSSVTIRNLSGSIIYRTDQNGTIRFELDGKLLKPL